MKKSTVSKLLSITLALSMTLGSGSVAVFADDAPATEEIEAAVVTEEDAEAAEEAVAAEEAEATEVETVVQPEAEAAAVEEIAVETTAAEDAAEIEVVAEEETEQEDAALAEEEQKTISWKDLYNGLGVDTTSNYDVVTSATKFTGYHVKDIPAVVNRVKDADGNITGLDGVNLSNTEATVTPIVKNASFTVGAKYGSYEFAVEPDDTVEGYVWNDYIASLYAVTISDGSTTVGALPWVDYYGEAATSGGHYNKVEIALNKGKSVGSNEADVHRFDVFYNEDGTFKAGTYTVTVYSEGFKPLSAEITTGATGTITVADTTVDAEYVPVTITGDLGFTPKFQLNGMDVEYADGKITATGLTAGKNTLTASDPDGKSETITKEFVATTDEIAAKANAKGTAIEAAEGVTPEEFNNYLKNISSVSVNGTNYAASGKRAVKLIKDDGTLDQENDALKDLEQADIVVTATGFNKNLVFRYDPNAVYVLMNIPYKVFYDAEGAKIGDVDTISSATNKTGNYGKAGGAYHSFTTASVAEDGTVTAVGSANKSQVKGVTWPVRAESLEAVKAMDGKEVTDENNVVTATNGKGKTNSQTLLGYETLTEQQDYSYYLLKSQPANYLELKDGTIDTSKIVSEQKGKADVTVSYGTNWGDVQLAIVADSIKDTSDKLVNAVVITAEDGTKAAFYHLDQIWANNSIGWKVEVTEGLDGKKITNIRYYCSVKDSDLKDETVPEYANYIYDYTLDQKISQVFTGDITAEFVGNGAVKFSGLPADAQNAKAKVYLEEGSGRVKTYTYITPMAVDPADGDIDPVAVDVKNGRIEITAGTVTNSRDETQSYGELVDGKTYTFELSSDNYIIRKFTCEYNAEAAKAAEKAEKDKAAADSVIAKLNALKGAASTVADQKAVEAARAAYNALSVDQKKLVSADVLKKLTNSETAVANAIKNAQTPQTVTKQSQSLKKLTPTTKKLKASKLKKKKQTFKLKATINGQGKVTFKKVSGNKKIKISKAGKVTVKKGLKKGTYKVKVKVSIAATGNYTAASTTKTIKIKVK